jgi:dihydrofolate reductase
VFIIGGSDIYRHFLDKCSKLHITVVDKEVDGDTYFPCTLYELTNKYRFNLIQSSNKILSKTDTVLFQYHTYSR